MSLLTGISQSNVEVEGVSKKYVNDKLSLKLTKSGDGMSGELDMNDNKIIDLKSPTNNTDASTKKYVDDKAALKLDLSGGQMTGPLGLGGGRLWDVATPTADTNGANKRYVDAQDTALRALCVLKAGSTMSGALNMDDNKISGLGTPSLNTDATTKTYVDTRDNLMVLKAGDTMSGVLNMGNQKITSLATPTNNTDASTKKYVDDKISSVKKISSYYNFLFRSGANNAWIQPATGATGRVFFTGNNDVKITMYAHIFDDDNSVSNLNLYYRIVYWTKTQVKKTSKTFVKTNNNKSIGITGTWLNVFFIDESITLTDIKCFRIEYKYFHTGNLGNESAVHCLIEYI